MATLELLTLLWLFNPSQPAQSTLAAQTPQVEFAVAAEATNSFTVKFTVNLKKFAGEKTILEIPNVLSVRLRQHDPRDRNRQNYPAFKMADGSVPVHNPGYVLDDKILPVGASMFARIIETRLPAGSHA